MPSEARRRDRLIGLCALGLLLFDPPIAGLFAGSTILGWPLHILYLFLVWAGIIAGVAWIAEGERPP
jgi:hypothetical protein